MNVKQEGKTALHIASAEGFVHIVKILLEYKARVDEPVRRLHCDNFLTYKKFEIISYLCTCMYRMKPATHPFMSAQICELVQCLVLVCTHSSLHVRTHTIIIFRHMEV